MPSASNHNHVLHRTTTAIRRVRPLSRARIADLPTEWQHLSDDEGVLSHGRLGEQHAKNDVPCVFCGMKYVSWKAAASHEDI